MLLALQHSTGSVFGGFRQWLKQGRAVRKGEHGAMIWVPIGGKPNDTQEASTTSEENNDRRFVIGTVFDISQTDALGVEHPIAVVSPEIADAFGMRGMPNVIVDEEPKAPGLQVAGESRLSPPTSPLSPSSPPTRPAWLQRRLAALC